MEKHLLSITFMFNCFILLLSFTGVISTPEILTITNSMRSDTELCNATKFLYDSKYTKPCTSLKYPTSSLNLTTETINTFLCLGVYDTAYKICHFSRLQTFINNISLNSYIENLVSGNIEKQENFQQEFCENLKGLTSLYNKTSLYMETLIKNLDKCQIICFDDFNHNLRPMCAILSLIKSKVKNLNMENLNMENLNHDSTTSTQPINQYEALSGTKISQQKESEMKKEITTDLNNKKVKQSMFDIMSSTNVKSSETGTNFEESVKDKTQTVDDTPINTSKINTSKEKNVDIKSEIEQLNKNKSVNNEISSKNNVENNVPNKNAIYEGKSDFKKKQNIDDVKTSTLSENTQDHYSDPIEDENIETGDMNDADDTAQQSNIGNPNEEIHVQETFEKSNLRFSSLRTEDDSHFFTYFTVIAMMCIIGYIGYCNKQKIFAIVLEGRRSKNNRGRRRPSTANYRKLDCTLEEAVTSQCNANVTHVIY